MYSFILIPVNKISHKYVSRYFSRDYIFADGLTTMIVDWMYCNWLTRNACFLKQEMDNNVAIYDKHLFLYENLANKYEVF